MLLNTHFYDGKMASMIAYLQEDLDRAAKVSKKEKIKAFNALADIITEPPKAVSCLLTIVQEHAKHGRGGKNFDRKNNLYACDLLYLVSEKITDPEHLNLLKLQLTDMATGRCPQGRTTRLFQTLIMLKSPT